ncbi:uncharacterized protein BYT42DRAFT_580470 [Radiomyces spectabilis]|uniref:uncharacterized protein n=1 Tax=Radiomyces spectabilis TaxID=64574 RepID=UPI00221FE426|nr:uncharacterized protein BYT42DRAFT_580470 [Radiomyces spectabilis]KAI8371499.1 hypothetical protein BYT42DRAFT_580470 [Radiomyces spectabilis]
MKLLPTSLAILAFAALTQAQEGATVPTGATTGGSSSYACDPNTCKIENNCLCASSNPPNGLSPSDTPQFVTITYDDSIQESLVKTARQMLNVTNPNGCPARGTWFVSMQYTDFSLVQQWYAEGHEVADHTFSHVGSPSDQEIASCKKMIMEYGGVPSSKIQGFRAPFLNYTKDTLGHLAQQGFLYDSSASAVTNDAYWPYTLDNGMANDCWTGICASGQVKLPGVWEVPMYAVMNNLSVPQLMDVYLAGTPDDVKKWSLDAFDKHYNGGRQPFGIYVHPTHLTAVPGMPDTTPLLDGVVSLIQELAKKPDVWFVTNQQLLQWMKHPVKASELANQDYMKCQQPVIEKEICNGLDDDHSGQVDDGLLNSCNFGNSVFKTCFNCPGSAPSVSNPAPQSATQNGTQGYRYPVPDNCDSIWWDPIGNSCLCSGTDCKYKDIAVAKSQTKGQGGGNGGSGNSGNTLSPSQFVTVSLFGLLTYALHHF